MDHTHMFSEPQTITVATVAKTLPRVSFGDRTGLFESVVAGIRLRITHTLGKRNRRIARFEFTKTAADPLLDGVSRQYSMTAYFVIDHPPVGFTTSELEANAKGALDWLSNAGNLTKVTNGEA